MFFKHFPNNQWSGGTRIRTKEKLSFVGQFINIGVICLAKMDLISSLGKEVW